MPGILSFRDWNFLNEAAFAFDPDAEYKDPTFGLEKGDTDTTKVKEGGEGGNWGGSMPRALAFAKVANDFAGKNLIASQKRSRQTTANGNISDHWESRNDSYAVDLACSGAQGDRILEELMKWAGFPDYKGGYWLNFVKNGYRYQIGWKVPDHFDHIHVGVRKTPGAQNTEGKLSKDSEIKAGQTLPPSMKTILRRRSTGELDDDDYGLSSSEARRKSREEEERQFQADIEDYKSYIDAIQQKKAGQ